MKLIGITGRKRAGKDTAANALTEMLHYHPIKFADPLKNMLRILLSNAGFDKAMREAHIEGEFKEAPLEILCGRTARHAMQTLGTEWGRQQIGEDFWIRLALARVAGLPAVVISDCRFANETAAVKAAGGTIIKIVREGAGGDFHASEAEIDLIEAEYTVVNNTTIQDLQQKVIDIANKL